VSALNPLVLALKRLPQHRFALLGAMTLVVLIVLSLAASWIEQWLGVNVMEVNLFERFLPPSMQHPLGTDELGRDLLVRLLYGGRVSLLVGIVGAILAAIIGTLFGLLAGYFGGRFDAFLMRFTDGIIALPLLPLLIVLAAIDLNKIGLPASITESEQISIYRIIFIIALFGWTTVARLVRGATLSVREHEFVQAAIVVGAGPLWIMRWHILPNVVSPIIIAATLSVGNIILLESVLSFLGLGIQPPVPSWGNMLSNAQEQIWSAPALAFYPGILIFITVMAFNFLGDGLQDVLDPRSKH
jgi:peptide/nickel transport system permease protein